VNISGVTGMKIQCATDIRFKNSHVTVQQGPTFILQNAQVKGME
jgi:hypothetical protein